MFLLDVTVPEEVEATVILPDGARIDDAKNGRYQCLLC